MRAFEIINEKRRGGDELNPKESADDIIVRYLSQTNERIWSMKNLFVSFTAIDKLGINPKSRFNTPLGIYSYPGEYVRSLTIENLPFANDQPFITIFRIRESSMDNIISIARKTMHFRAWMKSADGLLA